MYFSKKNKFFHGITFHHFHDNKKHKISQGSITGNDFYKIIKFIGKKNILNSYDFLEKFKKNKLKKTDLCLTFDDSLKCQYDIALPVLEDLKIKAFFFIYTGAVEKTPDHLEIFRYFRTNQYSNIDGFYFDFFNLFERKYKKFNLEKFYKIVNPKINILKKKYPFYSLNDIKFRLLRDEGLKYEKYKKIMFELFKIKKFNIKKNIKNIFLTKKNIQKINKLNHLIGLHSHSHPTMLSELNYKNQFIEYSKNKKKLEKIIGKNKIFSMSHPCGSYNKYTFSILKKLDIQIGFTASMIGKKINKSTNSKFEIDREDHANIKRMLKYKN